CGHVWCAFAAAIFIRCLCILTEELLEFFIHFSNHFCSFVSPIPHQHPRTTHVMSTMPNTLHTCSLKTNQHTHSTLTHTTSSSFHMRTHPGRLSVRDYFAA